MTNREGELRVSGMDREISLPASVFVGTAIILVAQTFLFLDASARDWAVAPHDDIPQPEGLLGAWGRWVAEKMTAICWTGVLFVAEGCLALETRQLALETRQEDSDPGSPVRERPLRFALCFLASIPIWLTFDWINFTYMGAWDYHGLPENPVENYAGYFFAFGAICPAMFLAARGYQRLGLRRLVSRPLPMGGRTRAACVAIGAGFLAFPILVAGPSGTLTLWLAWILVLDPINHRFGAPSVIEDLQRGRPGRPVALMASGLTCGLLWEFWNYWAVTKWTYHLPFLGPLEAYRYFEMPVVGLLGFAPFAIECWVMFQTVVLVVRGLGLRRIEPLPDEESII